MPLYIATASAYGSGCSGGGGPIVLAATQLPWLASTYTARSTGHAGNAVVLDVFGVSATSTPLPSLLPQGLPGCTLLASPDLLGVVLPAAGAATSSLVVPNDPWWIGAQVRHQHLSLEFVPAGLAAVAGSNGLLLTFGSIVKPARIFTARRRSPGS